MVCWTGWSVTRQRLTVNCFPASQAAGDQLGQFEGLGRDYFNRIFRPFFIKMMLITLSQAAKVIVLRVRNVYNLLNTYSMLPQTQSLELASQ